MIRRFARALRSGAREGGIKNSVAKFHPEADAEAAEWMMINTICGAVPERPNCCPGHFCFAKLEDDYTWQLVVSYL